MRLLILGGTKFLGRHLVDEAVARGDEVTIFHRGNSGCHRPEDVRELLGDRYSDRSVLAGGEWDAVVDTSGYLPSNLTAISDELSGRVGHYTFVSSVSVYADQSGPDIDETSPILEPPAAEPSLDEMLPLYGELKAGCEEAVTAAFDGAVFVPRPGLIVGPHDPTDRFTYWVHRADQQGTVLVPDTSQMPLRRIIDARDLASWVLSCSRAGTEGRVNAVDPDGFSFEQMIAAVMKAAGNSSDVVRVSEQFLLDQGVGPWVEMPLWIPASADKVGMLAPAAEVARSSGLSCRSLDATVADTLKWDRSRRNEGLEMAAGMTPERERELLELWAVRSEAQVG